MDLKENNAVVAHYYEELIFRARRVGCSMNKMELAEVLKYADSSLISKWLNGSYTLSQEKLNEVMKYIAQKEQIIGKKEILDNLRSLIDFLESR